MEVTVERVGELILTVKKNRGQKFYCLEDILSQTDSVPTPNALEEQQPIKLNCEVIFSYRFDGTNFIQTVFVDETGLKKITDSNQYK